MARRTIGTVPVQVAVRNLKRLSLSAQFLPSSIIAGNTGLIFGKFGTPPVASSESNTWDFLLNAGATDGTNVDENQKRAPNTEDLWLISDTAGQIVNVVERDVPEEKT